jgi:hypothetical protein
VCVRVCACMCKCVCVVMQGRASVRQAGASVNMNE